MMQNPELAFITKAIHKKSAFIHEAICAENEIKHEIKTSTITYPSHSHPYPHQQKYNKMLIQ
jgi:hypothetical protein